MVVLPQPDSPNHAQALSTGQPKGYVVYRVDESGGFSEQILGNREPLGKSHDFQKGEYSCLVFRRGLGRTCLAVHGVRT